MALSAKKEKKLSLASSHEFEQDSHAHSSSSVDGGTGMLGGGLIHVSGSFFVLFS